MQVPPTLELFVVKMVKLSIWSDIANQIGYQPQRLISINWTHKIPLKLERRISPSKLWILLNLNPPLSLSPEVPGPSPPPPLLLARSRQGMEKQLGEISKLSWFLPINTLIHFGSILHFLSWISLKCIRMPVTPVNRFQSFWNLNIDQSIVTVAHPSWRQRLP